MYINIYVFELHRPQFILFKNGTQGKPTIHVASETQEMVAAWIVAMGYLSKRLQTLQTRRSRHRRVHILLKTLPHQKLPKQRMSLSSGGARKISVLGANQFRDQHCGDQLNSQPSHCWILQWIRMPHLSAFSLMVVATKSPILPWCLAWFLCVSSSNFL